MQHDRVDTGRLTAYLTQSLNEAMDEVNPKSHHSNLKSGEEDESEAKLDGIEIELQEIAKGVRENL